MKPLPCWTLRSAPTLDIASLASLFNQAFADYLVRFPAMDASGFQRLLAAQGVDLESSRLVVAEEEPVGFGLIHRSNQTSRLAGMGIVPAARRQGAARVLLDGLLKEAEQRGDLGMILEVFEQNPPALKLYQSRGFERWSRLFGWRRASVREQPLTIDSTVPDPLIPVSLPEGTRWTVPETRTLPHPFAFPWLPFQISAMAILALPTSAKAYRVAETLVVLHEVDGRTLRWCALLPDPDVPAPWVGLGSVAARVMTEFPEHRWVVPALFPDPYGDHVFGPLGFTREPLNQWLMYRRLRPVQQTG